MGNTVDFTSVYQMQYILKRRTKAERKEVYHHERRIGSNTSNTGKRRGGKGGNRRGSVGRYMGGAAQPMGEERDQTEDMGTSNTSDTEGRRL